MRKTLIIISFYGMIQATQADVLDDALAIVVNNSPSLQGHEVILGVAEKKKVWTSKLQLGANYAQADTFDSASGTDLRARLTFEVPLFDDGGKGKTVAEQKQQLAVEKDRVIGAFLTKVTTVTMLERKVRVAKQEYELSLKKHEYSQKAQEEGVVEGSQLWQSIDAVSTAQKNLYLATEEFEGNVIEVSRQYGGTQHMELAALVKQYVVSTKAASVNSSQNSTPPAPAEIPAAPPPIPAN